MTVATGSAEFITKRFKLMVESSICHIGVMLPECFYYLEIEDSIYKHIVSSCPVPFFIIQKFIKQRSVDIIV